MYMDIDIISQCPSVFVAPKFRQASRLFGHYYIYKINGLYATTNKNKYFNSLKINVSPITCKCRGDRGTFVQIEFTSLNMYVQCGCNISHSVLNTVTNECRLSGAISL